MTWKHIPYFLHFAQGNHRLPVESPLIQSFGDPVVVCLNQRLNKESNGPSNKNLRFFIRPSGPKYLIRTLIITLYSQVDH